MSEEDTTSNRGRRTAVVLLTGLMAGAALGAVETGHDKSIRDTITDSFTPGARDAQLYLADRIVICKPN